VGLQQGTGSGQGVVLTRVPSATSVEAVKLVQDINEAIAEYWEVSANRLVDRAPCRLILRIHRPVCIYV
jgi:hypothetical protein